MSVAPYSARWREQWEHNGAQSIGAASARDSYGPNQIEQLIGDAVDALALGPEDSLLDIGCAAGLMGESLSAMVSRYVGIDYSANSLSLFRRRCPTLEILNVTASDLSIFCDGEFSKTLMSGVLMLMDKEEALTSLLEMRRVTRLGGLGFCSGVPELKIGMEKPVQSKGDDAPGRLRYSQCLWLTYDELEAMALCAGWARAEYRKMSPELPQFPYQMDCVLFTEDR